MVTGKNLNRMPLAMMAVVNFFEQNSLNKKLIIINTSDFSLKEKYPEFEIDEQFLDQNNLLLGDLRNIALSKVPENEVWVQWDDDDIKHPDYLKKQYDMLIKDNADAIILSGQMRYSTKKNTLWVVSESRIDGSIMAFKNNSFTYPSKSLGEDTDYIDLMVKANKKISYCPAINLYLRIIHKNNSWDDKHFQLDFLPSNMMLLPNLRNVQYNERLISIINFYNSKIEEILKLNV